MKLFVRGAAVRIQVSGILLDFASFRSVELGVMFGDKHTKKNSALAGLAISSTGFVFRLSGERFERATHLMVKYHR